MDQTARIRAVVESAWEAIRAKHTEGALSHHARGHLHFSLAPPLQSIGVDAEGLAAWFATWRGPIGLEARDMRITAGPDVAFCTSLIRMTGTKTDGEEVDLWYRVTLGLHQEDGAWRIVHEHESVPFHMDGSYRAAVDLSP